MLHNTINATGSHDTPLGNCQTHQTQTKYMHMLCASYWSWYITYIISSHHSRWCRPCGVSVLLLPWLSGRCPLLLQLWPSQFHSYKWWTHHCETCHHWKQKRKHACTIAQYAIHNYYFNLFIVNYITIHIIVQQCIHMPNTNSNSNTTYTNR